MNASTMESPLRSLRTLAAGIVAGMTLAFSGSFAFAAPEASALELKSDVFQEVEIADKTGKKVKQMQALTRALPGQEVIYVTTYRNKGAKPAENVVITNPLSPNLVYQPGSAQGAGMRAEVSVNGGKVFGALEKLTVPTPDGKSRPATAADVTTVRWSLIGPLKTGGEGKVTYRALVK